MKIRSPAVSRRRFLELGGGILWLAVPLLGCRRTSPSSPLASPLDAASSEPPREEPALCSATEPNIEGPYYRSGAPVRADLVDAGVRGPPLAVSGRILSLDCKSPLGGALLDVWQADGDGRYDNERFRLRGKLRTDAQGGFLLKTVVPGHYLNGRAYRPAHIHVKVQAEGHAPLTTQLYFPGDPYNAGDPFFRRSLIMDVAKSGDSARAHYEFVLAPAA